MSVCPFLGDDDLTQVRVVMLRGRFFKGGPNRQDRFLDDGTTIFGR
jgi:hypothetical protein